MKLLREYIRGLLVEQEAEQTPEQKISQVFLRNAQQALHLADQLGINPELVEAMEDAVENFHNLMRSYLYYAEPFLAGEYETNDRGAMYSEELVIKGDGEDQRNDHAHSEREDFDRNIQKLADITNTEREHIIQMYQELRSIASKLIDKITFLNNPNAGDPIPKDPKQHPAWIKAADWAGEPS